MSLVEFSPLLKLINSVKLEDIKTNTKKSTVFIYAKNEVLEREIQKNTIFITASEKKNPHYLGINIIKEIKDIYIEKYINERNWRRHKWMETYSILMDWKNQYC